MKKIWRSYLKGLLTREETAVFLASLLADSVNSSVLPTEIGNQMIDYMERYGEIWNLTPNEEKKT
jgi:hypothetical protein